MNEQSIKEALLTLDWQEAAVMYWRCQKVDATDISEKYADTYRFSESTVWNKLRDGRNKLKGKDIEEDPCEILMGFGEPTEDNWPPSQWRVQEPEEIEEFEEEEPKIVIEEDETTALVPDERVSRLPTNPAVIITGVVAVLLALALLIDWSPEEQVDIPIDMSTSLPDVSTDVSIEAIVDEPSPVLEPTDIPQPTNTPEPTLTPQPTPWMLLEEFDDADFDGWNRVVGNPNIVNGQLRPNGQTRWFMGDETWQNYIIEYAFNTMGCEGFPNHIGIRMQDDINMLIYKFGGCFGEWHVMRDGQEDKIEAAGGARGGIIRIRVVDDRVQMYRADRLVFDYPNTSGFDTGGFVFSHAVGPVDWIRVERLD